MRLGQRACMIGLGLLLILAPGETGPIAPASSAAPAAMPSLAVAPDHGSCGDTIAVSVAGFTRDDEVAVVMEAGFSPFTPRIPLATLALTDGAGGGTFTVPWPRDGLFVPLSRPSIPRTIRAQGLTSRRVARFLRFQVGRCLLPAPTFTPTAMASPTPTPSPTPTRRPVPTRRR